MTLEEWEAELAASIPKVEEATEKVVERGAVNVKRDARSNVASSGGRGAHAGRFINYEIQDGGMTAEVGYDKSSSGNLGNILEYGTSKNPPHNDLGQALDVEAEKFDKNLALAVAKVWR